MSQSCPAKHFTWSVVEGWILEFSEFQESLPGNRSNLITRALGRRSCNSCTMWFVDDLDSNGHTMTYIWMYMVRLHAWGSALKNIYIYICIYIYIYIYICIYIYCIYYMYTCVWCMFVSRYSNIFLKIHMHIYIYIFTYTYACTEYTDIHLVRFLSMEIPVPQRVVQGSGTPKPWL